MRSPGGWLYWLSQRLDPISDHPARRTSPDAETTATAVEACGHIDCDGHGWLIETDPRGRVQRCPRCSPAARRSIDPTTAAIAAI